MNLWHSFLRMTQSLVQFMQRNMISLTQQDGKHLKRYAKTSKRLIRAVKQSRIRQVRASARYQHGFQVPRDYNDAMRLDKENGNTQWQDANGP